jgi:PAS domain S-box-containing protein
VPSIQYLSEIIDSLPIAAIIVNTSGEVRLFNTQAEALLGHSRTAIIGKSMEELVPERFRSSHRVVRKQYMEKAQARPMGAGRDLFGLHMNGAEIPIEIGLSPISTEAGNFTLATIVDLTERRQRSTELQRANDALEQSNLDLQRFAYIASHDLQSPLRNISGFVQLLKLEYGGRLDEQADDWIQRTLKSIEQLQNSIRDLLAYSRVDCGTAHFATSSLKDVVDHSLQLLETSIRDSGAQINVAVLPIVYGDPAQLSQLVQNLIVNALKYRSSAPPIIDISAKRGVDEWVIAVRDNGIGIDPKFTESIFELFSRLHNHHSHPGSGIGLAVCRRVIQRHGGRIWVESVVGRGSIFYFTLPDAKQRVKK